MTQQIQEMIDHIDKIPNVLFADSQTLHQLLCLIKDCRTLLTAIQEQDWKPIETAPKDGTIIDLYFKKGGRQPNCFYGRNGWYYDEVRETLSANFYTDDVNPIYWRPLPTLPNTGE